METAPGAWGELHSLLREEDRELKRQMAGLSFIDETKTGDEQFIYQAGLFLTRLPADLTQLPAGLKLRQVTGGKFMKFVLKGSYYQLGDAYPLAFSKLHEAGETQRSDFSMEIYINTPAETEEEADLLTEIYLPIM